MNERENGEPLAYSLPNFALAVDVSLSKIRQCIEKNELVPSYVGTKPIVTRDEALRWLASLPTDPPAPRRYSDYARR